MSHFLTHNAAGMLHPPHFIAANYHYEVIMGSRAYGVADENSDMDIYGFCIPPKEDVFPHLRGEISGFGRQKQRFEQYQEKLSASREYDFSIYSIVKYFQLCMDNNPNMIDSLFVPFNCVTHVTAVGQMVRENRHLFLHKGAWHKFKGYAYSQINKARRQTAEGKRKETIAQHGYDLKAAYHVVRLMGEIEQILTTGDLNLQQDKERLKAIRAGEWTWERVLIFFEDKEKALERAYEESFLPHGPCQDEIKQLLLDCLEHHYGSLAHVVYVHDRAHDALVAIHSMLEDYWSNRREPEGGSR